MRRGNHAKSKLAGAGGSRRVLLRNTVLNAHNIARRRFGVPAVAWSDELAAGALAHAPIYGLHRHLRP